MNAIFTFLEMVLLVGMVLVEITVFVWWRTVKKSGDKKANELYLLHVLPILTALFLFAIAALRPSTTDTILQTLKMLDPLPATLSAILYMMPLINLGDKYQLIERQNLLLLKDETFF